MSPYNAEVTSRHSPLEERLLPRLRQRQEAHGRQLAADLDASPGAIAKALDRMERRGLVSSRWAGRTRLYRAATQDRSLIEDARRRLSEVPGIHPVALLAFGSRAKGEATADSDLDLVVIVPDEEATPAMWQRLRGSLRGIEVPIDLLLYSTTEARRWSRVPGNPMSAALAANGMREVDVIGV
jgi:DNA-binding MarR family transcriptional regulator